MVMAPKLSFKEELLALWKVVAKPRTLLLLPYFFISFFYIPGKCSAMKHLLCLSYLTSSSRSLRHLSQPALFGSGPRAELFDCTGVLHRWLLCIGLGPRFEKIEPANARQDRFYRLCKLSLTP